MLIDLHTHGKLSKQSDFSLEYFHEMMQEARLNGLDAVALTEHFNTKNYEAIYEALDSTFPYNGHYYEAHGVRIFPGIEVDIRETGHILLIGKKEEILAIRAELEPYTSKGNFIPFAQLLKLADTYRLLKIGGHPFRESTPLHELSRELLIQLDALDLNAKDLYKQGIEVNRQKLEPFAEELGLPIVAGSDTHQCLQYGSVVNRFNELIDTVEDLKRAIQNQDYEIEISEALHIKVKASVMLKKVLKQLKGEPPSREELEEARIG